MGVLNVTPDSFSDGGKFLSLDKAIEHAKKMIYEGADIIDVGGESSRPGSAPVSEEEELRRVLPVIEQLAKENVRISIDTYKPKVAEACIKMGATIVNDIGGLSNPAMIQVVAEHKVGVIIMHMQGKPKSMQQDIHYGDLVDDIKHFFQDKIAAAKEAGVEEIILDPGIGFGKTVEHNLLLLKRLEEFSSLGYPLLIGTSRKSFIGKVTGAEVDDRLPGSIASNVIGILHGASIIRVHDVKKCKQAAMMADAVKNV